MTHRFLAPAILVAVGCAPMPSSIAESPSETASPAPPAEAGLNRRTFAHDGETREYLLYVPTSWDGATALPVLINLHGFGGSARDQLNTSDMRPLAEAAPFFLLYPQGTLLDGFSHWNTFLPGDDNKSDADDHGFVDALLDTLEAELAVDPSRIYATGFSNGADFTYTLACFLDGRIAGIAPVAGLMWVGTERDCALSHPVSMVSIHGTADHVRPIGGYPEFLLSVDASRDVLRRHNGLPETPTVTRLDDPGATIDRYDFTGGTGDVAMRHYQVQPGAHTWLEITDDGLDTDALIWEFLSQFDQDGRRQGIP